MTTSIISLVSITTMAIITTSFYFLLAVGATTLINDANAVVQRRHHRHHHEFQTTQDIRDLLTSQLSSSSSSTSLLSPSSSQVVELSRRRRYEQCYGRFADAVIVRDGRHGRRHSHGHGLFSSSNNNNITTSNNNKRHYDRRRRRGHRHATTENRNLKKRGAEGEEGEERRDDEEKDDLLLLLHEINWMRRQQQKQKQQQQPQRPPQRKYKTEMNLKSQWERNQEGNDKQRNNSINNDEEESTITMQQKLQQQQKVQSQQQQRERVRRAKGIKKKQKNKKNKKKKDMKNREDGGNNNNNNAAAPKKLFWPATAHVTPNAAGTAGTAAGITTSSTSTTTTTTYNYLKEYNLKSTGTHIQIWEAKELSFPSNQDCRNTLKTTTPKKRNYDDLIEEFDTNIYPYLVETIFGAGGEVLPLPLDRDGNFTMEYLEYMANPTSPIYQGECYPWTPMNCSETNALFFEGAVLENPEVYYYGNPLQIVVLVDNIQDGHYYYDSSLSSSPATAEDIVYYKGETNEIVLDFTKRLVTTIDSFNWKHRLGNNPPLLSPDDDTEYVDCAMNELGNTPLYYAFQSQPRDVEGSLAHELYHLLSYYAINEFKDEWIEHGLGDYYGRWRMGYLDGNRLGGDVEGEGFYLDMKIFLGFAGDSSEVDLVLGGPEQSLNLWGDSGGVVLPADFGISLAFLLYIQDRIDLYSPRYDGADVLVTMEDMHCCASNIAYFDGIFIPAGLNNLLDVAGAPISGEYSQNIGFRTVIINFLISLAVSEEVTSGADVAGRVIAQDGSIASLSADNVTMFSIPYSKINWDSSAAYANPGAPPNGGDFVRLRDDDGAYLSADEITEIKFDNASFGRGVPMEWYLDDTSTPFIYTADLYEYENAITREIDVSVSGILEITMEYDMDPIFSFFYVMVYDELDEEFEYLGATDDSSCTDYFLYKPCLGGSSSGVVTRSFDLSDWSGSTVELTLVYLTRSQGPINYDGVKIYGMEMDSVAIDDALDLNSWQSFTEFYPPVLDWHVSLIAYTPGGETVWISELPLDENNEALITTSGDPSVADMIGGSGTTVGAIVSVIDGEGVYDSYFTYELSVNGVLQPGGS